MGVIRPSGQIRRAVRRSLHRFDANPIIDSAAYSLLTAEVFFGCLNRDVPEEKLNLFEFAASRMAEARASTPQIVGR